MRYNYNLNKQLMQGIITFILALLIVYAFKSEWDWSLALGIGIGNFITSGIEY